MTGSSDAAGAPAHKYRPDIDGLRAIAVAAVLGFHALPAIFPGGFVGVDIFFVISGYLITGVIAGDLAAGTFTYRNFYARRVRRIFPALAVTLSAAVIIAWAFLLPDEWRRFGKHLFAGAAFVSNLAFAREGGYFEWGADFKPLLHLWSLGVEEQFYFVWPLFLALLWKTPRTVRLALLILAIAMSFGLNLYSITRAPTMTFYLPTTRLWELALGSVLALVGLKAADGRIVRRPLAAETLTWIGILLCVMSIILIRENDAFPGAWALLPTLGTVFVIAAGPHASINRVILASRPFVLVGLISYPLYLWHWPLLSFLRIVTGDELHVSVALAVVTLAGVLSYFTFRLIERPIRFTRRASKAIYVVCGVLVVLGCIGLAAASRRLQPRLSSPAIADLMAAASDWDYPFDHNFGRVSGFERATVTGNEARAVLFIGDSHIEQYWPRLELLTAGGRGPELRFATNGGCPPLPGLVGERGDVCGRYLDFALQEARDPEVGTIVFGAYWQIYLDGHEKDGIASASLARFRQHIADLVRDGKRVYVILSSPASPGFDPRRMVSRLDGTIRSPSVPVRDIVARSARSVGAVRDAASSAGATVIDPLPSLCRGGVCPGVTSDGKPIYKDWSHLRPFYVRERAVFVDAVLN